MDTIDNAQPPSDKPHDKNSKKTSNNEKTATTTEASDDLHVVAVAVQEKGGSAAANIVAVADSDSDSHDGGDEPHRKVWFEDEKEKLIQVVNRSGKPRNWPDIAAALDTGRSAFACRRQYYISIKESGGEDAQPKTPSRFGRPAGGSKESREAAQEEVEEDTGVTAPWSGWEKDRLCQFTTFYGTPRDWKAIAKACPGRSEFAAKKAFYAMKKDVPPGWNAEEDAKLREFVAVRGPAAMADPAEWDKAASALGTNRPAAILKQYYDCVVSRAGEMPLERYDEAGADAPRPPAGDDGAPAPPSPPPPASAPASKAKAKAVRADSTDDEPKRAKRRKLSDASNWTTQEENNLIAVLNICISHRDADVSKLAEVPHDKWTLEITPGYRNVKWDDVALALGTGRSGNATCQHWKVMRKRESGKSCYVPSVGISPEVLSAIKKLLEMSVSHSKKGDASEATAHRRKGPDDDDSWEEGLYPVEEVLKHRSDGSGEFEYLVRWGGTQKNGKKWDDSWVSSADCNMSLVEVYWNRQREAEAEAPSAPASPGGDDDEVIQLAATAVPEGSDSEPMDLDLEAPKVGTEPMKVSWKKKA